MGEMGEMGEMRAAHRCSGHSAHVPGGLHDCELARAPLVLGESTVLLFVQREARARVRQDSLLKVHPNVWIPRPPS